MNFLPGFKEIKNFKFLPEVLLIFSFVICVLQLDLSWFNSHMSRDLIRAFEWLKLEPTSWLGPEMGWDFKRLPGPFYYWLIGAFWAVTHSIEGILFLKILFTNICIYFLIRELKLKYPIWFVVCFCMPFLFFPVYIETLRNLWNPSLIVAFGCLIFICVLKYQSSNLKRWLWFSFLFCFLGMQIHFSVLIPFLALLLTLFFRRERLKIVLIQLGLLFAWIASWLYLNPVPQLQNQLDTFYGFNFFIKNRVFDLAYHLSLSLKAIEDYDLFYRLSHSAIQLGWLSHFFVNDLNPILNLGFLFLFLVSVFFLVSQWKKLKFDFIFVFALFWFFTFVISFVITKHKPQMPYRYGLSLYPIQFFLLPLAYFYLPNIYQKLKFALVGVLLIYSAQHLVFILEFYSFEDRMGRTHHTQNDNLEMTLKLKKMIYSLVTPGTRMNEDPFSSLHGRAINKMRLKEMNWEQTLPYFGLFQAVYNKKVIYVPEMKDLTPANSWLLQLRNHKELAMSPLAHPFLLTELKADALPQNLVIKILNGESQGLEKISWKNSNLIMPLAFLSEPQQSKFIRLEFELVNQNSKFLNLLVDDNETYRFAYQPTYRVLQVKINKKVQAPIEKHKGYFLNQNQYAYKIPESAASAKIVIELKVETSFVPNYSRLDLFTSDYLLSKEELE